MSMTVTVLRTYLCDTVADLPTVRQAGERAITLDDEKRFTSTASTWIEDPSGGGGPHTHPISEVVSLQTSLDAKASSTHTHVEGDVTGLTASLAGKAASSHTHAQLHDRQHSITDSADHTFPGGTSTFLRADGTFATPSGGSDPWTYLRTTSDFTTSSATAVDVTGLAFAPAANERYEIEAHLLIRSNTATVNPRSGWAWATGLTDGTMEIQQAQTVAGGVLFSYGNINASLLIAVGGIPNNTQSWPSRYRGYVMAGASPAGNLRVQLASETAGTVVTVKAGSWLKHRTVP